jgi:hypothetical protein
MKKTNRETGIVSLSIGRAVAQEVSRRFTQRRPGFDLRSSQEEFVTEKVGLGKVYAEYFGFLSQLFHRLLHTNHHQSYGSGTVPQIMTYQVDSSQSAPKN